MKVYRQVVCPYCENDTTVVTIDDDNVHGRPFLVLCDIEDGSGCDRYFVVQAEMTVTVKSYAIEGINDPA